MLRTVVTDPGRIADALVSGRDLLYVLALAAPLGGAFLLAPALTAVAIPQLTVNGLSSVSAHTDPRGHVIGGLVPFMIAASVYGLARLPSAKRVAAAAAILTLSLGYSAVLGPWPGLVLRHPPLPHDYWYYGIPSAEHVDALHDAIALVPDRAPVAATNGVGSHLSARKYFFSVPKVDDAEWVVVDLTDPWVPLPPRGESRATWGRFDPALVLKITSQLDGSPRWNKVFERDNVFVFHTVRP